MAVSYLVLYQDLLKDLSGHLPSEAIDIESVASIEPWPDISLKEIRALSLAKSIFKKFVDGHDGFKGDRIALEKFLSCNSACRDWQLQLGNMEDELLVGLFKQEIFRFFNYDNLNPVLTSFEQILESGRTGPGASVGAHGNDFFTKLFSSPLTVTDASLYSIYEHYFSRYPMWAEAEKLRFSQYGGPIVVEGSRLSFVPKSRDVSRTICTEPNLNMFFQLGVEAILNGRLRQYFGIDVSNQQECNRDLAMVGSAWGDLCTIDLSSASDTVAMKMVESTFPRDVVAWIRKLRSPTFATPFHNDGVPQELHMVSSMGNGFTFPLETIIFSCIVSACYKSMDYPLVKGRPPHVMQLPNGQSTVTRELGNFGVFGDDIIVVTPAYRKVCRLLQILGFTVNAEKSFSQGSFRESCGGDFFKGHPVRGVYLKTLKTQASRYVAINRLNQWSAETGILLPRTVGYLLKRVRYLPIPLFENDDAGIKVPWSVIRASRFSGRAAFRDKRKGRLENEIWKDVNGTVVYRRYESIPKRVKITDGGFSLPKGAKVRFYNESGLLLAFLRGDIENGSLGIRLGPARYRSKEAATPNWDWLPTTGKRFPVGQARLASVILANMNM